MKVARVKFNINQARLDKLFQIIKSESIYQASLNHCDEYANGKYEAWIEFNFTWNAITKIKIRYTHYNKFADRVYYGVVK